jgi:hypothetical protein
MKNLHFKSLFKVLFITVCVIITLPLTNCIHPLDYSELLEFKASVYPSTSDFFIDGLGTYLCGEEYAITVTPKPDMTQGDITIYYEGYNYGRSDTPPDSAGAYTVTFDVAKAKGFYEVSGMVAGLLMINNPVYATPQKEDFDIDGLGPYIIGETLDTLNVTIEPMPGKTQGHLTIYYERYDYPVSVTPPSAAGAYTVTFNVDVDDDGQFNAAYGLFAGTLIINNPNPPTVDDFIINGVDEVYKLGDPVTVTVEPKDDRLEGKVTIFYEGYNHPRSKDVPSAVGAYTVTFDVAAVDGHSVAAYGLMAGSITIYEPVYPIPVVEHFNIKGLGEYLFNNKERKVTITAKTGSGINGLVTIICTKISVAVPEIISGFPKIVGVYNVTFDVAEEPGYNKAAQGLLAGMVIINENGKLIGYNEPDNPYTLTSDDGSLDNLRNIINDTKNKDKYFEIDLTGINSMPSVPYDYFSSCENLTSVTIADGIKVVENQFLSKCGSLESVIIGRGVETIQTSAIRNNDNLKSVIIGDDVTKILSAAISENPKLESVQLGNSVEIIGASAFYGCGKLTQIIFPNSLKEIGNSAFSDCGLTEVTIPSSVTSIGNYALNCYDLVKVTFEVVWTAPVGNLDPAAFQGGLSAKYLSEGAGTYIRTLGVWTKQ